MRYLAFFGLGMLLILLQENLFRLFGALGLVLGTFGIPSGFLKIPGLTPALLIPLIIFLGVREHPLLPGAILAFLFGYASDVIGAVPVGLYTFAMVSCFLLARALGLRLATQTRLPQMLVTAGFCLAKSGIILVCLGIFGRDGWVARSVYPFAVPHALMTALCAPLVFAIADKLFALTQTSNLSRSKAAP